MNIRRGVGRTGVARWGRRFLCITIFVLAGLIWPAPATHAGSASLDRHATVLNDQLIGSAFAISDGFALTNAHVVAGRRIGESVTLVAGGPSAPQRAPAQLVAVSRRMDLAVLSIPRGVLRPVSGFVETAGTGARVVALGIDPAQGAAVGRMAVSGRVVTPRIRIDAFGPGLVAHVPGVQPGFSGGPLLDAQGRLVGMVTAIRPSAVDGGPSRVVSVSDGRARAATRSNLPDREAYALRAGVVYAEARRLLARQRR